MSDIIYINDFINNYNNFEIILSKKSLMLYHKSNPNISILISSLKNFSTYQITLSKELSNLLHSISQGYIYERNLLPYIQNIHNKLYLITNNLTSYL